MIERYLTDKINRALADSPAVYLHGGRQTGKSTLLQWMLQHGLQADYITLDDLNMQAAAQIDPMGFVKSFSGNVVIDEVQRVPELMIAIKSIIDKNRQPGKFILTGSANIFLLPKIAESLTGRIEILQLMPFAQTELNGSSVNLVHKILSPDFAPPMKKSMISRDYVTQAIIKGGFPPACIKEDPQRRTTWMHSYITSVLQRDIRDVANIENVALLPKLLGMLCSRAGTLLNISDISRLTQIPQTTVTRYIAALQATFIINILPPWFSNISKRFVKTSKVFIGDTGLLCATLGVSNDRFEKDPGLLGGILENFVYLELLKQLSWLDSSAKIYHYRTHNGEEVDFILELSNGDIIAIEVKSAGTISFVDSKHLRSLQKEIGDRFIRGIVFYLGDSVIPLSPKLYALPISMLWE